MRRLRRTSASFRISRYTYDVENRLVSATIGAQAVSLRYDPMGAAAQGSGDAQHRWNGCGGRLYEVTGATTTRFLYDGDELVGEYTTAGAMLKRYVHGIAVDDPVIQYDGSGIASTALRHLIVDRQGSVIGIADSSGAIIARNTYDEYGIPKSDQAGQAVVGRFAYTGQIWLPELGMYHYKARLYSPTLGRFLQTDPIGYDDQINLYAYVGNDPTNKGDPSGESWEDVRNILVGAAEFTVGTVGVVVGSAGLVGSGALEAVTLGGATPVAVPAAVGSGALVIGSIAVGADGIRRVSTGVNGLLGARPTINQARGNRGGQGQGERGETGSPDKPGKHTKPDPNKPGNTIVNRPGSKPYSRPARSGETGYVDKGAPPVPTIPRGKKKE